jgi:hypothetical protein
MTPPVVNNSLSNNSPVTVVGFAGTDSNLGVVNRHRRSNNVNRGKSHVYQHSVLVRQVVELLATIQVNHTTPKLVVILLLAPLAGMLNLLAIIRKNTTVRRTGHQTPSASPRYASAVRYTQFRTAAIPAATAAFHASTSSTEAATGDESAPNANVAIALLKASL